MTPAPAPAKKKSNGCWGCLFAAFVFVAGLVFLAGAVVVVYLVSPPAPLTLLVLGLDARPGEGALARADSIMLVSVQPAQMRVSTLSIPRDLVFEAGEYGFERINAVHLLGEMEAPGGGVPLMQRVIEDNFEIAPDRYARIYFDGFVELIDAVGGVDVYVERALDDYAYPLPDGGVTTLRFEPGWQRMDGARALTYARTRHTDDDYQRAARQQQVLAGLLERLRDPSHWGALLQTLQTSQHVQTDMTFQDLIWMAPTVLATGGNVDRLVIDRTWLTTNAYGSVVPDYARLRPWIGERFG